MPLEHLRVNRQIAVPAGSAAALIAQGTAAHAWRGGNVAFGRLVSRGPRGTRVNGALGDFGKERVFRLLTV